MHAQSRNRLCSFVALALLAIGAVACADGPPIGIGTQEIAVSADTVQGTGSLSELQQHRAAWVARGITNYRVQLSVVCFCGSDFVRPVLVEVRGGIVVKAWDLETASPRPTLTPYPSITALFDAAIAERSRGGNVSVSYDRATGVPVRLEIGTIANDAGVQYQLGGLTPL
jgi:hypothetical protein